MKMRILLLALLACAPACMADDRPAADQPDVTVEKDQAAPDFSVTGIDGKAFKLSDKLKAKEKNVVLLFSRANW